MLKMVQRAVKFTPQVLLSAPRRSAGVPNAAGTKILYTSSTYSFETHKKTTELRVIDSKTGESHELAKDQDISDLQWLDNDEFAYFQAGKDSTTSLLIASVTKLLHAGSKLGESHYAAGKIDAPAENLKVHKLNDGFALVFSAKASPSGALHNPQKAKRTYSTAKLYSSLMVRHWDSWTTKEKNALWYGKLSRDSADKQYQLSKITNLLAGHKGLECPILPFGDADHFDLSHNGIVFVSKDPELNPALNTKCNVYVARIESWAGSEDASSNTHHLWEAYVPGFEGAKSSPVLNGDKAAFLSMKINGYEADQNRIFVIDSAFGASSSTQTLQATQVSTNTPWLRSPSRVIFSHDGETLLTLAEDQGATKVFALRAFETSAPHALTSHGSISDLQPLSDRRIFVSGSSLVDNSFYNILDLSESKFHTDAAAVTFASSNSNSGVKFGLKSSQISSIWTPASNPSVNPDVHSIVVKPSDFSEGKKYPVAYLIHGGPQGAWGDSWSTRWNPAVYAEQGYIVVAPNPTGSTGYGQAFTDAIRGNWGGDPYQDIVNVFDWVGANLPEADNKNAVALGASYGGYMMNWIQGHDLGRKFKALVNHDGITSFAGAMYATEELYFPFYELGATSWYDPDTLPETKNNSSLAQLYRNFIRDAPDVPHAAAAAGSSPWQKWDPSNHFAAWATPALIIHSTKDYRLPIGEGLAAFNVLQARGIESQFLTFPDENHWVLKPENSLVWHKAVLNWINKHTGQPAFAAEDEDSPEFFGGERAGDVTDGEQDLPVQGRPET